jgi:hypothetical protein
VAAVTVALTVPNTRYGEFAGSVSLAIVVLLLPGATVTSPELAVPNWFGEVGTQPAPPDWVMLAIALAPAHLPPTRIWTCVGTIRRMPTEPGMIFLKPTDSWASLKFVTEAF